MGPLVVFVLGALVWPAAAAAQWYLGEAVGGNTSTPSTVAIRAGPALTVDFHAVQWSAAPWRPRRYFLVRAGYLRGRHGLEVEYLHFKAIADTAQTYDVLIGPATPLTEADVSPMEKVVQTYRMTTGVNLLAVLYVHHHLIGTSRIAWTTRGGGGITIPYATTTIQGVTVRGYQVGGLGAESAIGLDVRLWPHLFLAADYRVTVARPTIDIADGRAWTTLVSHHGTVGLRYAVTR